jgi:hypothetical protein
MWRKPAGHSDHHFHEPGQHTGLWLNVIRKTDIFPSRIKTILPMLHHRRPMCFSASGFFWSARPSVAGSIL